jgi:hypothetical protein
VTPEAVKEPDVHWDGDVKFLRGMARESLSDPRIANYFSRGHVNAEDVLGILDDDEVYEECRTTEVFRDFAKKRNEVDSLYRRVAAAASASSLNWKTTIISISLASVVLLVFFELPDKNHAHAVYKILLSIFSAGAAVAAGFLFGISLRSREFDIFGLLAGPVLLGLSACAIALPLAFDLFSWQPVWLYLNLGGALVTGTLLGERKTAYDSLDLARVLKAAVLCMLEWQEREKHKKKWLEDSRTSVIYPNAVLAINRILGEDSTKLLVEQDSEGLRRLQDPALTVSTTSERKLRNLLGQMDGGSIAVTGPRDAGKTTLLRRRCGSQGHLVRGQLNVYTSAPAEYVAREFLTELFQQVCDAYLRRYDSPIAGVRYRESRTHRDLVRVMRAVVAILRLVFRMLFTLTLLAVAFGPLLARFHPSVTLAHLPVERWRIELTRYAETAWDNYQVIIQIAAGVLALLWWPHKSLRRRRLGALRRSKLIQRARSYSIHLKVERTTTWGANLGLPAVRGASLSLSKGVSEKYVPWSMPELVGKLREFIGDITRSTDGPAGTIVIGVDEIDRIGSVEQAERFIGEIKAVFGIPNCFFLVSVAEDVGFRFSRQSIVGKSTLEHSFDDVVVVDTLELDEARELLSKRVPGFTDSFVFLALALSGGLPREMIRVARRLVELNNREAEGRFVLRIGDLAVRLVAENIEEVLRTSRSQLARLSLPEIWGNVFYQLRDAMVLLRDDTATAEEHRKIIGVLCSLRSPEAADRAASAEADESAAAKIVAGLAAFASYSLTVIQAFDNEYFDLRTARKSTYNTSGGSYAELAAARLELGVSPESSQAIIRLFRACSGLEPLPDGYMTRTAGLAEGSTTP